MGKEKEVLIKVILKGRGGSGGNITSLDWGHKKDISDSSLLKEADMKSRVQGSWQAVVEWETIL